MIVFHWQRTNLWVRSIHNWKRKVSECCQFVGWRISVAIWTAWKINVSAWSGRLKKWKRHGTTIENITPCLFTFVKHDKLGPSRFPLFFVCVFIDMHHNFSVPEKYSQVDSYLYIIFCMTAIYEISLRLMYVYLSFRSSMHPSVVLSYQRYTNENIQLEIFSFLLSASLKLSTKTGHRNIECYNHNEIFLQPGNYEFFISIFLHIFI